MTRQETLMDTDAMATLAAKDKAPKPKPRKRRAKTKIDIKAKTSESVSSIGALMVVAGEMRQDPHLKYDGKVIVYRAKDIGAAVDEIANENPAVRQALERLFTASSWSKLALVSAQVAVPIMCCHGMVPPVIAGSFVGDPKKGGVGMPPKPKARTTKAKATPKATPEQPVPNDPEREENIEAWQDGLPDA